MRYVDANVLIYPTIYDDEDGQRLSSYENVAVLRTARGIISKGFNTPHMSVFEKCKMVLAP